MKNNEKKVIFSHVDDYGRRTIYKVSINEANTLKINLLEKSFTSNIGEIFMLDDNNEWKVLDYYND